MSIKEKRQILFDTAELDSCFHHPALVAQIGAGAAPRRIELKADTNMVALHYEHHESVELTGANLAVAMMRWCVVNGIPLPRESEKFIEVTHGGIVMTLSRAAHSQP